MARRELSAVMPNRMAEEFEKLYKRVEELETKMKEPEKEPEKETKKGGK